MADRKAMTEMLINRIYRMLERKPNREAPDEVGYEILLLAIKSMIAAYEEEIAEQS
jgi:hypothetical protein